MNIKINGSGFSKGPSCLKVSLPRDLKKAWPDRNNYSSVSYNESLNVSANLGPILLDLKVRKHDRILDIGAFKNEMVEKLHSEGFCNSVGIDVNPAILKSRYGIQVNFRDLKLKERYNVIYFNHVLGHFPGGMYNSLPEPSLQLFADKIFLHLLPKGYLMFCDSENNLPEFNKCLMNIGFKKMPLNMPYFYIFRKP